MKLLTNALLPTSSTAMRKVNMLFDEKIIKISQDEIVPEEPCETIDAEGLILLPGGVDPHMHMLGKDVSAAKDLSEISKTALEGGWTTLAEMSYLTDSPIFEPQHLKAKQGLIDEHAYTDTALWANVDISVYPYHAEAAQELWGKGVVGISLCAPSPNPAVAEISFTEIMDLFLDIYESDTAFAFQGYDHELHKAFSYPGQMDAIKKILRRMQENPIHIPRVASFAIIEFINSISKRSDISFAICLADLMQYFHPEVELHGWPNELESVETSLFDLLRTNKIYLLSNSSAPATKDSKVEGVFQGQNPETLPYSYLWVLSELWEKRKVPLATCIKMTSENAAKRLGLYPRKGCLDKGSDADFVLYDPHAEAPVKGALPGHLELKGAFRQVFLRGEPVAGNGRKTLRRGRFLPRQTNPKRRYNNTTWI